MSGAEPEERVRFPVLRQRWRHVLFLHWRYPVEQIAAHLPPDLEPDVADGSAWVSLTPFLVRGATVPPLPPVPRASTFPESNLRTYVRGPGGVDGLWFFDLEVDSLPTVLGGRLAVPYQHADMQVEVDGDTVRYRSRRRSAPEVGHDITAHHGGPLEHPTSLDHWLTGRWRAWVRRAGRLATVPVQHEPWPLHRADLEHCEQTLLSAAGLPDPASGPLVHGSPGVDAQLGLPRPA